MPTFFNGTEVDEVFFNNTSLKQIYCNGILMWQLVERSYIWDNQHLINSGEKYYTFYETSDPKVFSYITPSNALPQYTANVGQGQSSSTWQVNSNPSLMRCKISEGYAQSATDEFTVDFLFTHYPTTAIIADSAVWTIIKDGVTVFENTHGFMKANGFTFFSPSDTFITYKDNPTYVTAKTSLFGAIGKTGLVAQLGALLITHSVNGTNERALADLKINLTL